LKLTRGATLRQTLNPLALQRVRWQGLHFKIMCRLLLLQLQLHKQQLPLASHTRHDTRGAVRVPAFVYAHCTRAAFTYFFSVAYSKHLFGFEELQLML
jgi:hypothetical protein